MPKKNSGLESLIDAILAKGMSRVTDKDGKLKAGYSEAIIKAYTRASLQPGCEVRIKYKTSPEALFSGVAAGTG